MPRVPRSTLPVLVFLFTIFLAGVAVAELPPHPAEAFQPSTGCGCHAGLVGEWKSSMHSKALDDPLYLAKLDMAREEAGEAVVRFCEECHGAVAAMAGELDTREFSEQGGEGVTCDLCHQVTGTLDPIGNTSLVVQPDGTKRAQFADAVSPAHESEYSAFHETAEFCGMCHNVDHPANGLAIEATYTEWAEGPWAAEGVKCQDCHMTPGPGVTKPTPGKAAAGGPDRPHIYRMTFVGGNVALGNAALAEERLQAAAEIGIEAPDVVEPGQELESLVTITNVGAGHYLPTGLTDFRRMWLEVVVTDEDGNETEIGRREFHSVFEGADGSSPVEMWDAVAFASDDRIPPRESVSDTWSAPMSDGPLTVTATLYYRSCTEEFAEKAGVDVPTTTMTSATRVVYPSQEAFDQGRIKDPGAAAGDDRVLFWTSIIGGLLVIGALGGGFALSRRAG